ncbi:MAG: group II truncated hemoglobin [Bdellovibrionales bacterium]
MANLSGDSPPYGFQDTSYKAAGREEGLRKLSARFYFHMESTPEAQPIRAMHKDDLSTMVDKLTLFLSMWLGGPRDYVEKYGTANMPQAHRHLVINEPERDAWLLCMDKAVEEQPYVESFKTYLKEQLRFPAEMIRKTARKA